MGADHGDDNFKTMEIKLPKSESVKESMSWEELKKDLENISPIERAYYFMFRTFMRFADVKYNLRRIKWFFMRAKNGWAPCDTWSLDAYLSSWMPEALRYLKKNRNGFPSNSSDKEWEDILEKMALGFEASRKQDDIELGKGEGAVDEYKKKMDELEAIRKEGMNLFVEHYDALWD